MEWYLEKWNQYQNEQKQNHIQKQIEYDRIDIPEHIRRHIDSDPLLVKIMKSFHITNINCRSSSSYNPNLRKHMFVTYGNAIGSKLPMSTYKMIHPRATVRKFSNGISTCVGTTTPESALTAIIQANYSLWRKTGTLPWLNEFCVQNVVASVTLPYCINLQKLHEFESHAFVYDKSEFSGVRFRSSRLEHFSDIERNQEQLLKLMQQYKKWYDMKMETKLNTGTAFTLDDNEICLLDNYKEIQTIISNQTSKIMNKETHASLKRLLSAFWKYNKPKKVCQIFETGKINIAGAKTRLEIIQDLIKLEQYTRHCQIFFYTIPEGKKINLYSLYQLIQNRNTTTLLDLEFTNKNSKKKCKLWEQQRLKLHKELKDKYNKWMKLLKTCKSELKRKYKNKLKGVVSSNSLLCISNICIQYGINSSMDDMLLKIESEYKDLLQDQNYLIHMQQNEISLQYSFQLQVQTNPNPNINPNLNNHKFPQTDKITILFFTNGSIHILDADNKIQADTIYQSIYNSLLKNCCYWKEEDEIPFTWKDIQSILDQTIDINIWYTYMIQKWNHLPVQLIENHKLALLSSVNKRKRDEELYCTPESETSTNFKRTKTTTTTT